MKTQIGRSETPQTRIIREALARIEAQPKPSPIPFDPLIKPVELKPRAAWFAVAILSFIVLYFNLFRG